MTRAQSLRILIPAILLFLFFTARNVLVWREQHERKTCLAQLAAIEGAKEQFAIEHGGQAPTGWAELIPAHLKEQPMCPAGGSYTLGDMQTPAACSVESHTAASPGRAAERE